MKQSDFDRLKAACEKEGFKIESYSGGKTAIIGVKDIWEGVEFFQGVDGIIRPMNDDFKAWTKLETCNISSIPSTEEDYVDQLKKEAFKRFGVINQETIFDRTHICPNIVTGSVKQIMGSNQPEEWNYNKELDSLFYCSVLIYEKGKWATKLPERVKVYSITYENKIGFNDGAKKINLDTEIIQLLSSQLEKYLNGEIE